MPTAIPHPNNTNRPAADSSCLVCTCLKWGASGELSELDRSLVLQRLAQADPQLRQGVAESA